MKKTRKIHNPTIVDVARLAGVSPATVSNMLNGRVTPRLETERRVNEAIRKLKYTTNYVAKSLVTKKTLIISLLITDIGNPFFPQLAQGVENAAKKHGYNVLLCSSDGVYEEECRYIKVLLQRQIDGLIVVPSSREGKSLQPLMAKGVPIVVVDNEITDLFIDCIVIDNYAAAYEATMHLLQQGRRKIVFIKGGSAVRSSYYRLKGYRDALHQFGIPVKPSLIVDGEFRMKKAYDAISNLVLNKVEFDGVFAANDIMAIGAMMALGNLGVKIPEEIAVVGFDDIPLSSIFIPSLTTIRQPVRQMGEIACDRLINLIQGGSVVGKTTLQAELVIRQSSST